MRKKLGKDKSGAKTAFHVYDEGIKAKSVKNMEEGPFSIDDINDIENTIVSLQRNQTNNSEYGWTSPLKSNTPVRPRSAGRTFSNPRSQLSNLENTLGQPKLAEPAKTPNKPRHAVSINEKYDIEEEEEDDIDRKWEKIRRQMFPDLPPLPPTPQAAPSAPRTKQGDQLPEGLPAGANIDDSVNTGYSYLFNETALHQKPTESINDSSVKHSFVKPPLPPSKHTDSKYQSSPIFFAQDVRTSQIDEHDDDYTIVNKPQQDTSVKNDASTITSSSIHKLLTSTFSVPISILDKLKLAEKEYLCELARERQQELNKLKFMLEEGGRIVMADTEKAVRQEVNQQQKILCKYIEQYVDCLCKLSFTYPSPSPTSSNLHSHAQTRLTVNPKLLDNLRARIPTPIQNAIDGYIDHVKTYHKDRLRRELQEEATSIVGMVGEGVDENLDARQGYGNPTRAPQEEAGKATKRAQNADVTQKVLQDFDALAARIVSPSIASIFPSSSSTKDSQASNGSSVLDQIKMLERLSIHQLRINRELKEEEQKLRCRLAKMKNESFV